MTGYAERLVGSADSVVDSVPGLSRDESPGSPP
jgi:predicted GTPase